MNDSKKGFVHNVRQSVLTTLVLLLICGFLFGQTFFGKADVKHLPRHARRANAQHHTQRSRKKQFFHFLFLVS